MAKDQDAVLTTVEGNIGLIAINNAPVNALGAAVRLGLQSAIKTLSDNPELNVIAIYGEGRCLSAGADIREFGKAPIGPPLPDVLDDIENCPVPVISVVHGPTLGGGLELALATHARVGLSNAKVGLPEVNLGLLPGAGGTQRLPRLITLDAAIELITSARLVDAAEAHTLGVFDRLGEGAPREAALAAAKAVLAGRLTTRPTSEISIELSAEQLQAAKDRLSQKRPALLAPIKAVDAISHASKPIAEGLKQERALFMELMQSPDRQGLIHAFQAERAVRHIPEIDARPREIAKAGVIGGGTMGVGIATSLTQYGIAVTLIEMDEERAQKAADAVAKNLAGAVKRGKLTEEKRDALLAKLSPEVGLQTLADVDVVIEAVFEDIAVKTDIFKQLDGICKPGAVLGTNTSYLDVDAIAAATSRPADVIGLHFFSPAHVMRLLEVVVGAKTASDVVATAFDLAGRINKVAVRSEVCDGFIGNRILAHYRKAADYMLLDGASFEQIDRALEDFGFAMGPFAVGDLAGLDIGWATRKRKSSTRPQEERYVKIADRICEQGWFGRKTGRGYYLYDDPKRRIPNPDVVAIVDRARADAGVRPRDFDDEEIVARYMTAMIAEAARVVEEGVALRPLDVDAVFLFGYGFPRHLGGPLNYADRIGAAALVARIEAYAKEDAHYWQVPELLRQLAESGNSFSALHQSFSPKE